MARRGYVFDDQRAGEYNRLRAQVAFLAQQFGFDTVDVENMDGGDVNYQLVQLSSGAADGDGNYDGLLCRTAGTSMETGLTCKVRPATSGEVLQTGRTYFGRMTGYDGTSAVFTVFDSPSVNHWTYTGVKTSTYSAAAWEAVRYNVSGGGFTVYLPTDPAVGDPVRLIATEAHGGNLLTVDGGSNNVQGAATTLSLASANNYFAGREFVYVGGTTGWAPMVMIT